MQTIKRLLPGLFLATLFYVVFAMGNAVGQDTIGAPREIPATLTERMVEAEERQARAMERLARATEQRFSRCN